VAGENEEYGENGLFSQSKSKTSEKKMTEVEGGSFGDSIIRVECGGVLVAVGRAQCPGKERWRKQERYK